MTILSAEEFVRLRLSDRMEEYGRAAGEDALVAVWLDIVARFPEMRGWVAHNKSVPIEVLAVLAGDPDARIRTAVAAKRKLDPALFERLASDPDEQVRREIALNRKASVQLIERLAADPSPLVRDAAAGRLPMATTRPQ